ncbi:YbaB/EbfC family nucleoid-associated protein [Nocardioides terrisoli]|uniref:YbaB/EbfC family nucleoid-associated protein n=1 Tax=Nocardioides terrisoli TaxID=3388267 RepID=UPI00287B6958|nr:YbaB/EbfC family nucleoid-associated protein [Nocardioides marmorisolisilvae]
MTQNPFGEGGFDLGAMLEQAQQMQQQLLDAQAQLGSRTVTGSSGGVTVTLTGTGELTNVEFAPGSVPGDEDSLTDLGDLVVAAFRDAKGKADAMASDTLGPLTGGLGGPGGALGGPVV